MPNGLTAPDGAQRMSERRVSASTLVVHLPPTLAFAISPRARMAMGSTVVAVVAGWKCGFPVGGCQLE